ncbi:DUF2515 domain-containing protein [Alkalihalobacterium sp. APHAB7]|uniref:DUF2515 domain-containing protein n=1 Tax=Alkalihalobacterium sp. APHAB7 TaxID=3402081 RepID=UPI003AAADD6D
MLKSLKKLAEIPFQLLSLTSNKLKKYKYEAKANIKWKEIHIPNTLLEKLSHQLQTNTHPLTTSLSTDEKITINDIKKKTKQLNQNNITRTDAYLQFYKRNPEIHWAFLAHLVSRNGGWNMTDLKGNLLRSILSEQQQHDFFMFLEKANANIFQDAFPQLLLYEQGKQQNKNLFHLLPYFNVSAFMQPVWNLFNSEKNSQFLTIALIINEQHYIEKRVIHNPFFQENVLNTILFQAQEFLQFTQVLFPYHYQDNKVRLAGFSVRDFSNVAERIEIGKRLYSILFGIDELSNDVTSFADSTHHTGSRNDFWPNVFSKEDITNPPATQLVCNQREPIIYSPPLTKAWGNITHSFSDQSDWYESTQTLDYFAPISTPTRFDITHDYCLKLQKMLVASSVL